MPGKQQCTVCRHADLKAIDTALAAGVTVRACARQFGLKHAAIDRHRHHDRNAKNRVDIGSFARIDREIKKLHQAETRARKRRDNAMALQIAKELRSWFTLRVKAEAVSSAVQVAQPEPLTREEALALSKSLIETSLDDPDVVEWLQSLLERVPVTLATEPPTPKPDGQYTDSAL